MSQQRCTKFQQPFTKNSDLDVPAGKSIQIQIQKRKLKKRKVKWNENPLNSGISPLVLYRKPVQKGYT